MLEKHLQTHFGFAAFKKGQREVISKVLSKQSAAAIFPTGSGKSLCYQLPALLLPGITLVVSPLLALMKDQLDFLQEHHIPAARLDSTLAREEYNGVIEKAIRNELKILMISVERFRNERFRTQLQKMNISLLVIDEAHCISEWGHNFRPEYLKLPTYQREFQIRQVLLLTATATEQVVKDMSDKFDIPKGNVVITGFYRENLYLQVTPTGALERDTTLLRRIQKAPEASTIVYVTLQKTAEAVAQFLISNHINAHFYHAGMQNEDREALQNQFMAGSVRCIVATIAFGMGIDKKDIRRVIHYDLPKSIENYSQEIGRAGRDGKLSLCEVLANRDSLNVLENFVYGDTPEKHAIAELLKQIKSNEGHLWECKPVTLSNHLNIRILPLKTLLVYLDMEEIIRPKWTYFDEYSFKNKASFDSIANQFEGERKAFVTAILKNCHTKKIWTSVDMQGILDIYQTERQRIILALEYFEEKGWIELEAKGSVDVYEIVNRAFDLNAVTDKMYALFERKEGAEIQRIHAMVESFESDTCLSKRFAQYFGEEIEKNACGHCSVCKRGKAVLQKTVTLKPLTEVNFNEISQAFIHSIGQDYTTLNLVKFLCGINMPVFMKHKVKYLAHFGALEAYPYAEVKSLVLKSS
ncbi:MAG: RecQ family ATP-dependent DNA helicase [Gallionella sp.]